MLHAPIPRPAAHGVHLSRSEIEARIEALIAMLDHLDGDTDCEPCLGWPEDVLARGEALLAVDDREEEDEHGGDVQDECHDEIDEGDLEPDLGWRNPGTDGLPQGWLDSDECSVPGASLNFDQSGHRDAARLLRQHQLPPAPKSRHRGGLGR